MADNSGTRRRRPTIYDVARLAGVSTATVSRALNDTAPIAVPTRAAIDRAVAQLGYRPNPIARSLVTKSSQTIALLLPDITNPFYAELVSGAQEVLAERDRVMLLCATNGDIEQEARYLRILRAQHVDGALVDGLLLPDERIAAAVEDGFPVVCLDRDVDSPRVPLVQVDNRLGARLAVEHLLGLGHTRIAHITGPRERISDDRLVGYRQTLAAAGIAADPALETPGDFTEGGGHVAMRRLLESDAHFTAVFCANDLSAFGALNAILQSGRRVPADLSIVGFDDVRLSPYTSPPLTTVHQPAAAIARRATELLLDLIAGASAPAGVERFAPTFVQRASTAPPRSAAPVA
jgi:DNA-binding LacI/PurR family transcriptional regulator